MEVSIIDKKTIGSKKWLLCKCSLKDYILSLNEEFFNFDIQRGIVRNRYLDTILNTIQQGEPLPLITLTSSKVDDKDLLSAINDFEILDGLQRTYRLWTYYQIYLIAHEYKPKNLFGEEGVNYRQIIDTLKSKELLKPGIITVSQVRSLFDKTNQINVFEIDEMYTNYIIYLNIWIGLEDDEIIRKMLVLNAGQKPVSVGHQYELMFLHLFKNIVSETKLVREKNEDFSRVKNGNRSIGQFIFSSTIISLQSFIERKPLRLSIDYLENSDKEDQISVNMLGVYFSEKFIIHYLNSLNRIDYAIFNSDVQNSLKWFVKDTTMSGVLAAIGSQMPKKSKETISIEELIFDSTRCFDLLIQKLQTQSFKINEFFNEYDNLASTRVNIGDVVREAIFRYTVEMLNEQNPTWSIIFHKHSNL